MKRLQDVADPMKDLIIYFQQHQHQVVLHSFSIVGMVLSISKVYCSLQSGAMNW
jgi:hypothetical protein